MTLPPLPPLPHSRDSIPLSDAEILAYAEQYGRLCAEAEREAAALVAERWGATHEPHLTVNARNAVSKIARAIRARSKA